VTAVLGEIVPPAPADGVTVNVPVTNVAATVQAAVIAPVVYVFPAKLPPHVPPTVAMYPAFGVTVNVFVCPAVAVTAVLGEIVPPVPADGVTVNVPVTNVAATVQAAVIARVVYVFPAKLPPHVPPTVAVYPAFGVTVNVFV